MSIKCVIVEDYEPLNTIYGNLLGYERDIEVVGKAVDSEGLFKILEERKADVILLDIEMKRPKEGIETCKSILSKYPDIKVVMLTCHDEEETILSAFEAGAVDYVLKTSSSIQILEAIRSAHNNSSSLNSYVAYVLRKHMKDFGMKKESLLDIMCIISGLTVSEVEILKLLIRGKKQREIAELRNVELVTVKAHVSNILKKFNKERATEITRLIRDLGIESFIDKLNSQAK